MSRQRLSAERRRVLRRQALEAGVPWRPEDEFEDDDGDLLAVDLVAWGAAIDALNGSARAIDDDIREAEAARQARRLTER